MRHRGPAPDELGRAAEEVRIARETLLELPEPVPPAPSVPKLPDRPAHQQTTVVLAADDTPLRARRRPPARSGRHRSHDKR